MQSCLAPLCPYSIALYVEFVFFSVLKKKRVDTVLDWAVSVGNQSVTLTVSVTCFTY